MDITKMLAESGMLEQLAGQYGLNVGQVEEVVKMGIPKISKAINNNTSSREGMKSFIDAVNGHKNVDLDSMIRDIGKVDREDGDKILGHIFGNDRSATEAELSQAQGISAGSVSGILSILAPILMGMMGNKMGSRSSGFNTGDIFGSILGSRSGVGNILTSMLDKNNDGNVVDDILGKFFK